MAVPETGSIYDWAVTGNLQPEPVTLQVWRNLPEDFCRQVEVVSGQAVRAERPDRAHQAAARQIAGMLDAAAEASMAANPGTCLDAGGRFSVLVWEDPAPAIRSPDAALFACAPDDVRTLTPEQEVSVIDVPVRIEVDWGRLARLVRQ